MSKELSKEERLLLPERQVPFAPHEAYGLRCRLEAARRHRHVSQEALAEAIGIGVATLRRIEAKRQQKTPVQILARCALVLDVPLSTLIDAEDLAWTLPGEPPTYREVSDVRIKNAPALPKP